MYVLGLNCFSHDSSAALLKDGRIVAAAEQERFDRVKHSCVFPRDAIKFCMAEAKISPKDVDEVAFFWIPRLEIRSILKHLARHFPGSLHLLHGASVDGGPVTRIGAMLLLPLRIRQMFRQARFHFVEHHLAHAASAFFVSPFSRAAILSVDGVGEWDAALLALGQDNRITKLRAIPFPHSLGLLYAAVTEHLGFRPNSDEWKVMALAAYGKPTFYDTFCELLRLCGEGGYQLDMDYFRFHLHGAKEWVSQRFISSFGPSRNPDSQIEERHMDIAHGLQRRTEDAMLHLASSLQAETGCEELCIAGGVGLNSVANGKILASGPFKRLFVQPAPNDAGTSLGAALYVTHQLLGKGRGYSMDSAALGPSFTDEEIRECLVQRNLRYEYCQDPALTAAQLISKEFIAGWFQGRMEYGPRALGNRSILADPRRPEMRQIINARVKYREEFRPLAPSVIEECLPEYFESDSSSPFMQLVFKVRPEKRALLGAVTHVDGTARVQTVNKDASPLFWSLIRKFGDLTGVPVVLNTSFNLRGEPIVCSPSDAVDCFLRSKIDCLLMGSFLVRNRESDVV